MKLKTRPIVYGLLLTSLLTGVLSLDLFGSFIQTSVGGSGVLSLPGATAATRYVGATTSGAPVSGTFAVGDFLVDQSGSTYVCTTAGTPGTWTKTGSSYTLPTATNSVLGGVKPDGTTIVNTAGAISVTPNPAFTTIGYSSVVDNGNSGSTKTINWTTSNVQNVTLTANCTFSFTAPSNPGMLLLTVNQTGSNVYTSTWPTVKWAGGVIPVTSTASGSTVVDVMSFYYNGTSYHGACSIPNAQ